MRIHGRNLLDKLKTIELWPAVALGAAGFILNMLALQFGWGMHFMFGNAIVFAFIRVLRPQSVVLAGAIASLQTVFQWNHPWAWGIWTLEAAVVAHSARKTSPVRRDVIFWLLAGAPLIILTYGMVMKMDWLSLVLVIAKQGTNGVLNVVLGEMIYLAALFFMTWRSGSSWPKMPVQSIFTMVLLAIILIPTTVYIRLDAPTREEEARDSVDRVLQERLRITDATLSSWTRSRSVELSVFAAKQLDGGVRITDPIYEDLSLEFSSFTFVDSAGKTIWSNASNDPLLRDVINALPGHLDTRFRTGLVAIPGRNESRQLTLVVPFVVDDRPATIIAPLRQDTLQRLLHPMDSVDGSFLIDSGSGVFPLSRTTPELTQMVRNLRGMYGDSALRSAALISDVTYGNALMSDLRDARMVRASTIAALPDWQILAIASLAPEVLKAREGQVRTFVALSCFVVLLTLLASLLSRWAEWSLRQLAQSAADLALMGTKRDQIDRLMISELSEVSDKILSAGRSVSTKQGALVNYQRRLNSIAQHAPVMVYAFEVSAGRRGELIYLSETAENILGYTRQEATHADWWDNAIHPDDFDRCIAAFSDLQPGKVVSIEYRMRHALGHFVWVFDTFAVEEDRASGDCEAIGVSIDITAQKAAAEQLLQADKMASLGRMISGTAHELNQPLNYIKMATSNLREYALRGQLDIDRCIAKSDSILSHVDRASAIILQMRIFGRTASEALFPLKVTDAVDAVLTMAAPQLELDGTQVETNVRSVAAVRALPVLLEQVFLNLILNANDAIRARRNAGDLTRGLIRITVDRMAALAIITFEDNGTGLAPDIMPAIFEPFFTTKPPKEGTGLGLPISYGIIKDLGGTIRAENAALGARFIIEMPATKLEDLAQPAETI